MFSRLRLSTQLWLFLLVLMGASSAALTWYVSQVRAHTLASATQLRLKMKEESLAAKAALLARNGALGSATATVMADFEFLQEVVSSTVRGDPTIVHGYIADASDKVVVHSDPAMVGKTLAGSGKTQGTQIALVNTQVKGVDALEAVAPIIVGADSWGAVHYAVSLQSTKQEAAKAKEELRRAIRRGVIFGTMIAAIVLALSIVITIMAARALVRPVLAVENAVQMLLAGKSGVRVEVPRVPELARVANGVNNLIARLREGEAALRAALMRTEATGEVDVAALQARAAAADELPADPVGGVSLRARILGLMLGLTALSVLALGGLLFERLHADLEQSLHQMAGQIRADQADKGYSVTRNAALAASQAAEGKDFLFLVELVRSTLRDDADIVTGFVEDPKGRVLIDTDPQRTGTVNVVPEHTRALETAKPQTRMVTHDGVPALEVTAPIQVGGASWGTLSFGLSQGRLQKVLAEVDATRARQLEEAVLSTAAGIGALMLLALLVAWFATRRIVGPLVRLTRDLERIRNGDLDVRVRIGSCREFATFAMGINELTVNTADRKEKFKRQIETLVAQTKRRAAHDALFVPNVTPRFESVSVSAALDGARDALARHAREKQVQVVIPPLTEIMEVQADPRLFADLLRELMANAIQCSKPNGAVRGDFAAVEVEGKRFLRVRVSDNGPGISKDDAARLTAPTPPAKASVFQRGIGFSIAKRVVELHHGRLRAEAGEGGVGTTLIVELPLGESPA